MAKKRSKSDKIKAKARLKAKPVVNKKNATVSIEKTVKKETEGYNKKLFSYDPKFIWQDLTKTLIVTIVVLVVLALLALRYT